MGMICPECGSFQPITRNATLDGAPARKASDIVVQTLACGHVVYADKYKPFAEQIRKINAETAEAHKKLENDAQAKKAAVFLAYKK